MDNKMNNNDLLNAMEVGYNAMKSISEIKDELLQQAIEKFEPKPKTVETIKKLRNEGNKFLIEEIDRDKFNFREGEVKVKMIRSNGDISEGFLLWFNESDRDFVNVMIMETNELLQKHHLCIFK